MIKATILGFLCFILFLAVHIIVFRSIDLKERFRALTIIFIAIVPFYVFIYLLIPASYGVVVMTQPVTPMLSLETINILSGILNFMSGLMFYVFLFLGYCQFYFIVDRSISVRVMIEIEKSKDKKLSFDDIMQVYSFNGILTRRLEHMVEGDYVIKKNDSYINTDKGRYQAKLFNFLKEFLRLGPGG